MRLIIFIGPIGSGKGTQAEVVAKKFGLIHIETSKLLEKKFKTADPSDKKMVEQKALWHAGILNDPSWVTEVLLDEAKKIAGEGKGMALSASPRTLFEAEKEIPVFEETYGRDNIFVFNIALSEAESIKRNSGRRICEKNRHPIPNFPEFKDLKICPEDGSKLITRALDNPETIKIRYQEYLNRTEPILNYLNGRGYNILKINGEQPIEKVSEDILKNFND
ncbi:MAG: nucleoside monophosphate kinase [Candidatus Yanofskybacteria bacterium]|nr:nucleoside monophosphate kinase [Candidatus Yanofskybacteria bacterium]